MRVPLVLWNGKIIDGRNRYEACQELGIDEFEIEEFEGSEDEMVEHVVSLNMSRRQLTSGQKAVVGVELGVYREKLKGGATAEDGKRVIEIIADELGTNRQYLYDAEKLKKKDSDLFDQVRRGELTLSAAMKTLEKLLAAENGEDVSAPVKPETPVDHFGKEVPKAFEQTFAERETFKYAVGLIREAKKAVESIVERGLATAWLDASGVKAGFSSVDTALKTSMPHALCPYCEGAGGKCEPCKGHGWVNRPIYDYAPEEKK